MAQALDTTYSNVIELGGFERSPPPDGQYATERRLFRIGVLTLGVLCVMQATLNISLRLAFYPKEDVEQSLNSSMITDLSLAEETWNLSQKGFSCQNLLRKYQALKRERDLLRAQIIEMTEDNYSGAGPPVDIKVFVEKMLTTADVHGITEY